MKLSQIAAPAIAAGAFVALVACSSTSNDSSTPAGAPVPNVVTEKVEKAATSTVESVAKVLGGLGYDCSAEDGYQMCVNTDMTENWQVKASPTGDGDKAYLSAGCKAGAVDDGRVLTNGKVVIYAGLEHDLNAFNAKLANAGVTDLRVIDHCK